MRSNLIAVLVSIIGVAMLSPMGATALAAGPVGSAGASNALILGGMTSQRFPVLVEVSRNGRQLKRVVAGMRMHCSSGGRLTEPENWTRLRISRRGAFKATYRDTFTDEGDTITFADTFSGRINARRTALTATWRLTMVVREPSGAVDTCDSGTVRIKARR